MKSIKVNQTDIITRKFQTSLEKNHGLHKTIMSSTSTIQELVESWNTPRPSVNSGTQCLSEFKALLESVVQDLILISRLSIVQEDKLNALELAETIGTSPELRQWTGIHLDFPSVMAKVQTFDDTYFVGRTEMIQAKKLLVKSNLDMIRKMLVSNIDAKEPICRIAVRARQMADAEIARKQTEYLVELQKLRQLQEKLRRMKIEIDEACWAGVAIDRTEPRRVWEETLAVVDQATSTLRELDVL